MVWMVRAHQLGCWNGSSGIALYHCCRFVPVLEVIPLLVFVLVGQLTGDLSVGCEGGGDEISFKKQLLHQ